MVSKATEELQKMGLPVSGTPRARPPPPPPPPKPAQKQRKASSSSSISEEIGAEIQIETDESIESEIEEAILSSPDRSP
jgi:hypothetical protein